MESSELSAVWGCLHDGYIVAISTSEGQVSFEVQCRYLAEALGHPGERAFRVAVSEPVEWTPWERREGEREPPSFEDIAAHEADVLSAEEIGSQVGVTLLFEGWNPGTPSRQSGGSLLLQAARAVLHWADGEPLATAELLAASARYWDAFGSTGKADVSSREEAVELGEERRPGVAS
ncbi:MAG: hypothetical protein KTR31_40430 [Myxococcales bacterium]|nr:hypothetical protein [Myxococcales bacterium]